MTDKNAFDIVENIIIERNKIVDSVILGEIQKIAVENGIETKIVINEKAVANVLRKQIPQKIKVDDESWLCCPCCGETFYLHNNFMKRNKNCGKCGQALDWSDIPDR